MSTVPITPDVPQIAKILPELNAEIDDGIVILPDPIPAKPEKHTVIESRTSRTAVPHRAPSKKPSRPRRRSTPDTSLGTGITDDSMEGTSLPGTTME